MRASLRRLALLASRTSDQGAPELWWAGNERAALITWETCSSCQASTSNTTSSSCSFLPPWGNTSQAFRGFAMASRHKVDDARSAEARGVTARNVQQDPYNTPPQNFVQLLIHIKKARTITYLEKLLNTYNQQFDAVHCSAAITRLPKLVRRSPDPDILVPAAILERGRATLNKLEQMVWGHIPGLYPRQISNIIWALGQMKHLRSEESYRLVRGLLEALQNKQYNRFFLHANQLDVANLCSGLAQLGVKEPRFMSRLAELAIKRMQQFQARQVSQVAWGYAKLGVHNKALMDALAQHAVKNVLYFGPQGMINTLWAFATLQHKDEKLFAAVAEAADLQIERFKAQDLAVATWAFAKFGHHSPELMNKFEKQALECLERFTAVGLCMLLQGFAKLGHPCSQLLDAVATGIATEKHVRGRPEDMAGIAGAYATLKHQNEHSQRLFEKLAEVGKQLMPLSSASHLRTLLTSSHELGYLDEELVRAAAQHLLDNCLENWKLQDTALLLADFHHIGLNDANFFSTLATALTESPDLITSDPGAAIDLLLVYERAAMPCKQLVEATAKLLAQSPAAESVNDGPVGSATGQTNSSSTSNSKATQANVGKMGATAATAGKMGVTGATAGKLEAGGNVEGSEKQGKEAGEKMVVRRTGAAMKLWKLASLLYCCARAEVVVPPELVEVVVGKLAAEDSPASGSLSQTSDGAPASQSSASVGASASVGGSESGVAPLSQLGTASTATVVRLLVGLASVDARQLKDVPWSRVWEVADVHAEAMSKWRDSARIAEAVGKLPDVPATLLSKLSQQE